MSISDEDCLTLENVTALMKRGQKVAPAPTIRSNPSISGTLSHRQPIAYPMPNQLGEQAKLEAFQA